MDDDFSNADMNLAARADDAAEFFVNGTSVLTLPDGSFNDPDGTRCQHLPGPCSSPA